MSKMQQYHNTLFSLHKISYIFLSCVWIALLRRWNRSSFTCECCWYCWITVFRLIFGSKSCPPATGIIAEQFCPLMWAAKLKIKHRDNWEWLVSGTCEGSFVSNIKMMKKRVTSTTNSNNNINLTPAIQVKTLVPLQNISPLYSGIQCIAWWHYSRFIVRFRPYICRVIFLLSTPLCLYAAFVISHNGVLVLNLNSIMSSL